MDLRWHWTAATRKAKWLPMLLLFLRKHDVGKLNQMIWRRQHSKCIGNEEIPSWNGKFLKQASTTAVSGISTQALCLLRSSCFKTLMHSQFQCSPSHSGSWHCRQVIGMAISSALSNAHYCSYWSPKMNFKIAAIWTLRMDFRQRLCENFWLKWSRSRCEFQKRIKKHSYTITQMLLSQK